MSLMRCRTASAECDSPPCTEGIEAEKKYFSSNTPRGVETYLFEVTRETVDSCISTASATVLRLRGRSARTPCTKKPSCWRTISLATLRIVRARWSSDLISQLALAWHSERKALSSSVRDRPETSA